MFAGNNRVTAILVTENRAKDKSCLGDAGWQLIDIQLLLKTNNFSLL